MAKEKVKKEKPVNDHPNKIGIKEAAGYTIAEAGNMFNLTYISSFLKVFLTDVIGISAGKAGTMFMVTRIWDCINDPLWGAMVAKRAPSKNGKFRPILNGFLSLSLFPLFCASHLIISSDSVKASSFFLLMLHTFSTA